MTASSTVEVHPPLERVALEQWIRIHSSKESTEDITPWVIRSSKVKCILPFLTFWFLCRVPSKMFVYKRHCTFQKIEFFQLYTRIQRCIYLSSAMALNTTTMVAPNSGKSAWSLTMVSTSRAPTEDIFRIARSTRLLIAPSIHVQR